MCAATRQPSVKFRKAPHASYGGERHCRVKLSPQVHTTIPHTYKQNTDIGTQQRERENYICTNKSYMREQSSLLSSKKHPIGGEQIALQAALGFFWQLFFIDIGAAIAIAIAVRRQSRL